jgi:hypothetical protein
MFHLNESVFFEHYASIYPLQAGQAAGLGELLGYLDLDPRIADPRWAAYMLATVKYECVDLWQPIEEFGKGRNRPYGVPVTVTDPNGKRYTNVYYGRGYIQLTWEENYQRMGQALGIGADLVYHPDLALAPARAYQIMSYGMCHGSFTGRSLSEYISGTKCDYFNAREIINGHDSADRIAQYAQEFSSILRASGVNIGTSR